MALPFSRSDEVERFLSYLIGEGSRHRRNRIPLDSDKEAHHGNVDFSLVDNACHVLTGNNCKILLRRIVKL